MISLKVSGKRYEIDMPVDTPLLWVIREQIGLPVRPEELRTG